MNELIPESEFLNQIFSVIYANFQQGMTRSEAISELNRAEIFAGLWDAQHGCLTEKVFREGAAKRMHHGEPIAAGSTVPFEVWYDKAKSAKVFGSAVREYRNHLLEQRRRRDESTITPTAAQSFTVDVGRDAFKNIALLGERRN